MASVRLHPIYDLHWNFVSPLADRYLPLNQPRNVNLRPLPPGLKERVQVNPVKGPRHVLCQMNHIDILRQRHRV